ncbi:Phage regulatory protein (fragment) [uncultured Desulfobacterium sp.]|uniref:Phage regulatory protein n=1 Tax=uncultured Desulfobacterium sp. TaxID=201089 RepID=A0A445MU69_9BACT
MRLWRRFSHIEKLDVKEKRQVIQLLDTFIEKERLKKAQT